MEESSPRSTIRASLTEWRVVAEALTRLAGLSTVRAGLAAEIHAAVAAHEHRWTDVALVLRPGDAAVVRAIRACLWQREADQTIADVEAFLALSRRRGRGESDHDGPSAP